MKRLGAVIVFHPDVDKEHAAAALERIRRVLDIPETARDYILDGKRSPAGPVMHVEEVPFSIEKHMVEEFDDKYGGPVWYIP